MFTVRRGRNAVDRTLLATSLAVALISPTTAAFAGTAELIAFGRANAGKAWGEVTEVYGVRAGETVTANARFDPGVLKGTYGLRYDSSASVAVLDGLSQLYSLTLLFQCAPVVSTSPGVEQKACEHFVVMSQRQHSLRGVRIPMTAEQFKKISVNGVQVQADVVIPAHGDGPVSYQHGSMPASSPAQEEVILRFWRIGGEFKALRWKLPGDESYKTVWTAPR